MKHAPTGIYFVAVMFFLAGFMCIAALLPPALYALGFERSKGLMLQSGSTWVLTAGIVLFWLLCYGVVLLVRLHPAPQWVFCAMTLFLMIQFLAEPGPSPFYSSARIYLNRFLLLLPLVAGSVYLLRPSFRKTCREIRAARREAKQR